MQLLTPEQLVDVAITANCRVVTLLRKQKKLGQAEMVLETTRMLAVFYRHLKGPYLKKIETPSRELDYSI